MARAGGRDDGWPQVRASAAAPAGFAKGITKDNTTLYASDRDVFLFLVDDLHQIEAGRLPNGHPDLFFRGFYAWNSEVGSKKLGMSSFHLRAVCMNRNI